VNERYKVIKKLSEGINGLYYEGFDTLKKIKVGIRMEGTNAEYS
jgi:hypothetical protein